MSLMNKQSEKKQADKKIEGGGQFKNEIEIKRPSVLSCMCLYKSFYMTQCSNWQFIHQFSWLSYGDYTNSAQIEDLCWILFDFSSVASLE